MGLGISTKTYKTYEGIMAISGSGGYQVGPLRVCPKTQMPCIKTMCYGENLGYLKT